MYIIGDYNTSPSGIKRTISQQRISKDTYYLTDSIRYHNVALFEVFYLVYDPVWVNFLVLNVRYKERFNLLHILETC